MKKSLIIGIIVVSIVLLGVFLIIFTNNPHVTEENQDEDSNNTDITEPPILPEVNETGSEVNETESEIEPVPYIEIWPKEANELIKDSEVIVIDVSHLYSVGHLPGAVHYQFSDGSFENEVSNLDKDREYLIYSGVEINSKEAAQMLVDEGFKQVYRLRGSYTLWVDQGYDFEK
jgi:phage shock protein E